jgi:uncharacterized protein
MLDRPGRRTNVPAGTGRAVVVRGGGRAHVVNTEGSQVADMWALALPDAASRLSTSHTRLAIGRISPRPGDVLVDNRRQPMLRVLADTSPGGHDTLIPSCDAQRYRDLGFEGEHANCTANFLAAVAAHGLTDVSVPEPVNLFMSVPVTADGALAIEPSKARPGDEVVLEALRDVLLVVSACPQDLVRISGTDGALRQVDIFTG